MATILWNKWASKKDNPYNNTDIIVRRKNGEVVFAFYETNGCYHMLTYKVEDITIMSYIIQDFFQEGDEWIYVETLKNNNDMDYEKNKEAVSVVKQMVADGQISQDVAEKYFPELAESEDERIRKWLIRTLKALNTAGVDIDGAYEMMLPSIAYLEKQGEQKPDTDFSDLRTWKYIVDAVLTEKELIGQYRDRPFTEEVAKKLQKRFGKIEQKHEWSEEDEAVLDALIRRFEGEDIYVSQHLAAKCLKSLKDRVQPQPKQEWSKEDEKDICEAAEYIRKYSEYVVGGNSKLYVLDLADRIESLRPQKQWKPSEEQMKQLEWVAKQNKDNALGKELTTLYEQLKAL